MRLKFIGEDLPENLQEADDRIKIDAGDFLISSTGNDPAGFVYGTGNDGTIDFTNKLYLEKTVGVDSSGDLYTLDGSAINGISTSGTSNRLLVSQGNVFRFPDTTSTEASVEEYEVELQGNTGDVTWTYQIDSDPELNVIAVFPAKQEIQSTRLSGVLENLAEAEGTIDAGTGIYIEGFDTQATWAAGDRFSWPITTLDDLSIITGSAASSTEFMPVSDLGVISSC